jgi:hypothetical protein
MRLTPDISIFQNIITYIVVTLLKETGSPQCLCKTSFTALIFTGGGGGRKYQLVTRFSLIFDAKYRKDTCYQIRAP